MHTDRELIGHSGRHSVSSRVSPFTQQCCPAGQSSSPSQRRNAASPPPVPHVCWHVKVTIGNISAVAQQPSPSARLHCWSPHWTKPAGAQVPLAAHRKTSDPPPSG